jgi:hypothetical protein
MNHYGKTITFEDGNYYEKVRKDGTPVQRTFKGDFMGFENSDTKELAASKEPECAIFAVLKNYINETGDACGLGINNLIVNVYEIEKEPDIDMENSTLGDFSMNREVRFRNLNENPVIGELYTSVSLPGNVLGDIELTYVSCGGGTNGVIESWGNQVQNAIKQCIENGTYPEDVSSINGVDRPSIKDYYA